MVHDKTMIRAWSLVGARIEIYTKIVQWIRAALSNKYQIINGFMANRFLLKPLFPWQ